MKISPNLYKRMDGLKFWCFPLVSRKVHAMRNITLYSVYQLYNCNNFNLILAGLFSSWMPRNQLPKRGHLLLTYSFSMIVWSPVPQLHLQSKSLYKSCAGSYFSLTVDVGLVWWISGEKFGHYFFCWWQPSTPNPVPKDNKLDPAILRGALRGA